MSAITPEEFGAMFVQAFKETLARRYVCPQCGEVESWLADRPCIGCWMADLTKR